MKCPKCGNKNIYKFGTGIIGYICRKCRYYWNKRGEENG